MKTANDANKARPKHSRRECPLSYAYLPRDLERGSACSLDAVSEPAGFLVCARLSFNAAIRSMTGASLFGCSTASHFPAFKLGFDQLFQVVLEGVVVLLRIPLPGERFDELVCHLDLGVLIWSLGDDWWET